MDESTPQSFRLNNGLRVILKVNSSAPVVALQAWVKTGSADETESEAGIAHVHEHMLFKGTAKRRVGEIASEVESLGGQINAYTTYDHTVYHLVLASRHTATGLDILGDAIQNSTFDEEELQRELCVVLEEWKRSEDSPGSRAYTSLLRTAFPQHPYGRPIIGYRDSILSINRKKVLDFFHRWYRPNNMILVLVGDLDPEGARREVEEVFGSFAPAPLPERAQGGNGQHDQMQAIVERSDFLESYLNFAFPIPSVHHEDIYALQMMSFIMGGGESSRLYRIIKSEQQVVNSIFAHAFIAERGGLWIVGASLEHENVRGALEQMVREVCRLKYELVDPQELRRAHDNLESDFLYRKETSEGQAQEYGYFESVFGDFDYEDVYLTHLARVRREDLRRVARKYFNPQALSLSLLTPKATTNPPSEAEIERSVASAERSFSVKRRRSDASRSPAGVTAVNLNNGLRVLIQENHNAPLVCFRAAALGGLLFENEQNNGINNLVAELITRGTVNYDYARLAQEVEGLAGGLDGFSGRNSVGLTATFLSKNAFPGLTLFLDALVSSSFREDEIEKARQEILFEIKNREDDPPQMVFDLFHRTLFQTHPYRFTILGSRQTMADLSREDIVDYYHRAFAPERVVLSVVGDIKTERVLSRLNEALGALAPRPHGLCLPPIEAPCRQIRRREEVREKKQAHIVIGFPSCAFGNKDSFALRVLQAVLARQGGRLFMEIREKRGLAYSVNTFLAEGVQPGTFGVYVGTDAEKIDEAIDGVLKELERVTFEEVPEKELERARKYITGSYEIGRQTVSDQSTEICFNELYGLGYDFGNRFVQRVEAVDATEVLEAARRYIRLDAYTLSILRPAVPAA